VATQNRWLVRGLDPESKAGRLANYLCTLRKELISVARACGVCHPALLTDDHIEILDGRFGAASRFEVFDYRRDWGLPSSEDCEEIRRIVEAGCPKVGKAARRHELQGTPGD
jgi:hypothetical protein